MTREGTESDSDAVRRLLELALQDDFWQVIEEEGPNRLGIDEAYRDWLHRKDGGEAAPAGEDDDPF